MSDSGLAWSPIPEHQTTPEAPAVQRMLAAMRDAGYRYAVVESSSHGLSPRTNRLGDVDFEAGVMMNVTREHLEFHGSWEQYRSDKAELFRAIGRRTGGAAPHWRSWTAPIVTARFGVVNADDPSAEYFRAATDIPRALLQRRGGPAGADPAGADLIASDLRRRGGRVFHHSRAKPIARAAYRHGARWSCPEPSTSATPSPPCSRCRASRGSKSATSYRSCRA